MRSNYSWPPWHWPSTVRFRSGELVAASKADPGRAALLLSGVSLRGSEAHVRLRRSETDQRARGSLIILKQASGSDPCPVRSVADYLVVRPGTQGLLFLIHADGTCLSRYQLAAVLRACIEHQGLPPDCYGTHSFRIGAATHAFESGLSQQQIMALGRWRSAAYKGYVRPGGGSGGPKGSH